MINDFQAVAEKLAEFNRQTSSLHLAYLFGSRARGKARHGSDVDVGILLKEGADQLTDLHLADYLSASFPDEHFDIVVLNHASPILQHEVIRDGVRLLEDSPMRRRLFELKAFRDYVDAVYYQNRRMRSVAYG